MAVLNTEIFNGNIELVMHIFVKTLILIVLDIYNVIIVLYNMYTTYIIV